MDAWRREGYAEVILRDPDHLIALLAFARNLINRLIEISWPLFLINAKSLT